MDGYEMQVRAANIVRAGESLMNLVSDIKQFLILNDFPSLTRVTQDMNVKHNVTHHIVTTGQPVHARPRRLAPEKMK